MRIIAACLIALASMASPTWAFSPYEAYLKSGEQTHVGLIAVVKKDSLGGLKEAFKSIHDPTTENRLKDGKIDRVQAFTRTIEGKEYVVVYFRYAGGQPYLDAAAAFESATDDIDWNSVISPHPRAVSYKRLWLQMEWINLIRGVEVQGDPTSTTMIATTVIPEKEMQYRTLHQTVWPGVVDQAVRGKIRNLNIFLVELDDLLVEFLYLEYMGNNQQADDQANKADPINQRWWKLTDECQRPFSDVTEGIWTSMSPVK